MNERKKLCIKLSGEKVTWLLWKGQRSKKNENIISNRDKAFYFMFQIDNIKHLLTFNGRYQTEETVDPVKVYRVK